MYKEFWNDFGGKSIGIWLYGYYNIFSPGWEGTCGGDWEGQPHSAHKDAAHHVHTRQRRAQKHIQTSQVRMQLQPPIQIYLACSFHTEIWAGELHWEECSECQIVLYVFLSMHIWFFLDSLNDLQRQRELERVAAENKVLSSHHKKTTINLLYWPVWIIHTHTTANPPSAAESRTHVQSLRLGGQLDAEGTAERDDHCLPITTVLCI